VSVPPATVARRVELDAVAVDDHAAERDVIDLDERGMLGDTGGRSRSEQEPGERFLHVTPGA
jgi:hypothetical protein